MNTIRVLLHKEFLQIFRNRAMLPILFVMPIVQLLVLSFAATYELREVDFALADMDRSALSRELGSQFQAAGYFVLKQDVARPEHALEEMDRGNVKMILHIPKHFQRDLTAGQPAEVQLLIDAVDGSTAGLIQSYATSIIERFNQNRRTEHQASLQPSAGLSGSGIQLHPVNWYNPDLNYLTYMVPGILVVLVSMIALFLSGMNIVREQELGTIEQINVTPIKKHQFILGKLIPFWIIGMAELLIGLALARYGFQIPFLGSLTTILLVAGVFMVVVQAIGLFISTLTHTQQQAMFIAWFVMVVFILLGGLFTPVESMPGWAQALTLANPVAHFIAIMRMVMLKGAGWEEIAGLAGILAVMGTFFLGVSISRYRKTSG